MRILRQVPHEQDRRELPRLELIRVPLVILRNVWLDPGLRSPLEPHGPTEALVPAHEVASNLCEDAAVPEHLERLDGAFHQRRSHASTTSVRNNGDVCQDRYLAIDPAEPFADVRGTEGVAQEPPVGISRNDDRRLHLSPVRDGLSDHRRR